MIGLSVSLCIKDILDGKVQIKEVKKIIGSTRCETTKDWEKVLDTYYFCYWNDYPKSQCLEVFNLLLPIIEQPRLTSNKYPQIAITGRWVNSEEEIVYVDL